MATKQDTVNFNLPLDLPKGDFEAIAKISKSDAITTLKSWVPWWLKNHLGGGIMLQPEHVTYLNKLKPDGTAFREATEIVKCVEKALGREEGQFTFQVAVDPARIPGIEQRAKECSVEPLDLIQRAIMIALTHPDLMNIASSMDQSLIFDRDQYRELAKLTGTGTPFGADVLAALRKLVPAEADQPEPAGTKG
jgi:hypothetical protein